MPNISIKDITEDCWIKEPDGRYYFYSANGKNLPIRKFDSIPNSNSTEYKIIYSDYFTKLKRHGIKYSPAYPYVEDIYGSYTEVLFPDISDYRCSIHYDGGFSPIYVHCIYYNIWSEYYEEYITRIAPVYERSDHSYIKTGETYSGSAPSESMIEHAWDICQQKDIKSPPGVVIKRPFSLPPHEIEGVSTPASSVSRRFPNSGFER